MNSYIKRIINLPGTIAFNLKAFGLRQGIKLPVYITNNVKIRKIRRGGIIINSPLRRFMIEIGDGGSEGYPSRNGSIVLRKNSNLVFDGTAFFAEGTMLRINEGGVLHFGNNFNANTNCTFWCSERIVIGADTLFGFDIVVRDGDGHKVSYDREKSTSETAPITIGNHVWCAANTSILKGSNIPDGCVIGYNSCVLTSFEQPNLLIGGYPAKKLKENVTWKK